MEDGKCKRKKEQSSRNAFDKGEWGMSENRDEKNVKKIKKDVDRKGVFW